MFVLGVRLALVVPGGLGKGEPIIHSTLVILPGVACAEKG